MRNRISKIVIFILFFTALAGLFFYFLYQKISLGNDFTIRVNKNKYNVISGKCVNKLQKYPLVIYHHGGRRRLFSSAQLRDIAAVFADNGFLFWAPERNPWIPTRAFERLKEAHAVSKAVLDYAIKHPGIDKGNIHVIGFDLGSWVAFADDARSPYVKSVSLLGFGAPYDMMHDYVTKLINTTSYDSVSARILVMVTAEDADIDIETAEILRKNMAQASKIIDCVQYAIEKDFISIETNLYLEDLLKYLKGEMIHTSASIRLDESFKKKWKSIRETGYW